MLLNLVLRVAVVHVEGHLAMVFRSCGRAPERRDERRESQRSDFVRPNV